MRISDWSSDVCSSDLRRRWQFGAALAILRIALGLFLLVWGLEKFIVTERSVAIYGYFYGISVSTAVTYALGALASALDLAIIFGSFRRWSSGFARKAVVSGNMLSVLVKLGGLR